MMEHANWIQKWSHYAPDSIMLEVDGGDRWSYARASRLVHIIADCLQQRHHIGRGDRVAVLSQNVPECIFSVLRPAGAGRHHGAPQLPPRRP